MPAFLRPLLRRPLHPALAVGILAVGLAASISTFTYIRAFEQPFPGVQADGLVRIVEERREQAFSDLPYLDYRDYLQGATTLELAAVQRYYAASVRLEESAEVARIEAVAGEYFPVLGATAHIGRLLGPDDDAPGAAPAAVISHDFWQSSFGGTDDVLGRTVLLNFRPFTVVGVASPDFMGSNADYRPRVWMPIEQFRQRYTGWNAMAENRELGLVTVLGRLRDGATPAAAAAEMHALAAGLEEAHPRAEEARRVRVEPAVWIDPTAREAESATLTMMMIAAAGFLLLVCANVASVLLSLASTETRADAIRAAIGAEPRRLLGAALGRNLVLAGTAGILGILMAMPLSARLGEYFARPSVWGEHVPRSFPTDASVVAFGIGLALLTGVLASIPTLRAIRGNEPGGALNPDSDVSLQSGVRRTIPFTLRDGMVMVQSGLAVALLVLSGLVLRTFAVTSDISPGFETSDLLGGLVSVSSLGIERPASRPFFDELLLALEQEPWVASASQGDRLPLEGRGRIDVTSSQVTDGVPVVAQTVRHHFVDVLGVEVREGRDFQDSDEGSETALLNRAAAARLFPGESAVGRPVFLPGTGGGTRTLEVIGVVEDVKLDGLLDEPDPAVFVPFVDEVWPTTNALLIRTAGPADGASVAALRAWLRDYAPHMTIINTISYRQVLDGALYSQRMNAELFTLVAVLGLLLACAGVFSVVSLAVTRRRREIGIRKAVGATEWRICVHMVRRALAPVVAGGVLGLLVALLGARLMESLLFGVSPTDPATLAAGTAVLFGAAALAALLPAWSGSRTSARSALMG